MHLPRRNPSVPVVPVRRSGVAVPQPTAHSGLNHTQTCSRGLQPFAAAWRCSWAPGLTYRSRRRSSTPLRRIVQPTREESYNLLVLIMKGQRYQARVIKLDWDDELLAKTVE